MPELRMRVGAAALTVLTVFALSGCGDDDQEASATSSAGTSDTSDATSPVAAEEDSAAEEAVDEVADGEECLHGNWYLKNETFQALLTASGGAGAEVTGFVVLSFDSEGKAMTTYDEWTTVVAQDGGTATMVRNGDDVGTYSLAGDTLTMTETDGNSVVSMTITTGDGQTMTMTPDHETAPVSNGTFTCDADTLTVTADGGMTEFYREH